MEQTFPDGSVYEGALSNGQPNGFGVMTWPDGTRQEGCWENDDFLGE